MKSVSGLTGLAGYADSSASIAVPGQDALYVDLNYVTHEFFQVIGMRLAAGRSFAPDEDREPGGMPVAILGYRLATTLFGEPGDAVGRSLLVNGLPVAVVGVAPWRPGST